jgi:hypothetical protein
MSNVFYNVTLTPANVTSFGIGNAYQNLPKVFPNGNSPVSSKVDEYVDRYNAFLCKSADAFIALGETLYEAKENLNKDDFKIFLEKTGLNNSKSTYSKLLKIGEEAPRLRPYVNNLPQNWTTLYALSKLEADQFEKVVPQLNAYSTAKELSLLTEAKPEKKDIFKADVTLCLVDLDLDTKHKVLASIKDLEEQYKFSLKVSSDLENELSSEENKVAA